MFYLPETAFYVLHRRPYQESSLILDVFTYQSGRLSLIAKGAKRRSRQWATKLQPFILLQGQWRGKGEMASLIDVEIIQQHNLHGRAMLMGFYINELMLRLLQKHAPCPEIFELYNALMYQPLEEKSLRYFEKDLLDTLGYGFSCQVEAETGEPIDVQQTYYFQAQRGFVYPVYHRPEDIHVDGDTIQALQKRYLSSLEHKRQTKQVLRRALAPLLGAKPLYSRTLFYHYYSKF